MSGNLQQIAPNHETDKSSGGAIDGRRAPNYECNHPICERASELIGVPDEYLRTVGTLTERPDGQPTFASPAQHIR